MSAFTDKEAVHQQRELIADALTRMQAGGKLLRSGSWFRDARRLHKATLENAKAEREPGSRWWRSSLGERVVSLEAELERMKRRAVMIDAALEAGDMLRSLSDEAIAVEYDRRGLNLMWTSLRGGRREYLGTWAPTPEDGFTYSGLAAAEEWQLPAPPPRCAAGKCSSPRVRHSDYCARHVQERCSHAFADTGTGHAVCTNCGGIGPELGPTTFTAQAPKDVAGGIPRANVLGCHCAGCSALPSRT